MPQNHWTAKQLNTIQWNQNVVESVSWTVGHWNSKNKKCNVKICAWVKPDSRQRSEGKMSLKKTATCVRLNTKFNAYDFFFNSCGAHSPNCVYWWKSRNKAIVEVVIKISKLVCVTLCLCAYDLYKSVLSLPSTKNTWTLPHKWIRTWIVVSVKTNGDQKNGKMNERRSEKNVHYWAVC